MRTRMSGRIAMFVTVLLPAAMAMAQQGADVAKGKEAASEPGLLSPDFGAIIWILAIFTVLAIILYSTAWKNVLKGLKGREDRIRGDIAQAEAARLKAEETLKE